MTVVVTTPASRTAEREYAAHVLLGEFLGLEWRLAVEDRADVRISVDGHDGELRYADGLFAVGDADWLAPASLPSSRAHLPHLWENDPFGTAFFCLTRYEEIVRRARDAHDRFPAAAAFEPARPLVNEVLESLWSDLQRAFPRLARRGRTFEIVPTHDVDIPSCRRRRPRTVVLDLAKRRDPRLALLRARGGDPCDTFRFLFESSERRSLRSAFYFIADDHAYDLDGQVSLIREANARGHEVGLHPSYDTYRDGERLARELERLRRARGAAGLGDGPLGGRQHYLRFEAPTTWRLWDDAGLAYDSTLAWAEASGFRCGVCYEFPVFDLRARRMLSLRERPLIAMEATFLQYLRLDHERALAAMAALKETCRRYHGRFVLLWHNDRLQSARDRALYEAVLDA